MVTIILSDVVIFLDMNLRHWHKNLTNNFYFGVATKQIDIRKKEYEYDFTRDNPNFNSMFLNSATDDNSRIYKVYEDAEIIRRAKRIVYEKI